MVWHNQDVCSQQVGLALAIRLPLRPLRRTRHVVTRATRKSGCKDSGWPPIHEPAFRIAFDITGQQQGKIFTTRI